MSDLLKVDEKTKNNEISESIYEFIYRQNGTCHKEILYRTIQLDLIFPKQICDIIYQYGISSKCQKCKNNIKILKTFLHFLNKNEFKFQAQNYHDYETYQDYQDKDYDNDNDNHNSNNNDNDIENECEKDMINVEIKFKNNYLKIIVKQFNESDPIFDYDHAYNNNDDDPDAYTLYEIDLKYFVNIITHGKSFDNILDQYHEPYHGNNCKVDNVFTEFDEYLLPHMTHPNIRGIYKENSIGDKFLKLISKNGLHLE
jgi:hypothetical protein